MAQSKQHTFERLRDIFPPAKASMRSARSKPGVVFDPAKCSGCGLCESVCASVCVNDIMQFSRHPAMDASVPR